MEPTTLRGHFGHLPAVLVTILETVGEEAMRRIVGKFGGVTLIPFDVNFARAIDEAAAKQLAARFAADHATRIYIPLMLLSSLQERDREIAQWRAEGVKIDEIARRYSLSARAIYKRLAYMREQATNDRGNTAREVVR